MGLVPVDNVAPAIRIHEKHVAPVTLVKLSLMLLNSSFESSEQVAVV